MLLKNSGHADALRLLWNLQLDRSHQHGRVSEDSYGGIVQSGFRHVSCSYSIGGNHIGLAQDTSAERGSHEVVCEHLSQRRKIRHSSRVKPLLLQFAKIVL